MQWDHFFKKKYDSDIIGKKCLLFIHNTKSTKQITRFKLKQECFCFLFFMCRFWNSIDIPSSFSFIEQIRTKSFAMYL